MISHVKITYYFIHRKLRCNQKILQIAQDLACLIHKKIKLEKENYNKAIVNTSNTIEGVPLKLSDDLSIDYKLSQEDRNSLPNFINEMPHWINQDGSSNYQAIVQDSIKIKNFDNIVKLAYEQGLSAGKDQVIKEAKNITIDQSNQMNAQQGIGNKKPRYENLPDYSQGQKLSIKFNK